MKTYLVPVTDELIKAMEKGEAPSFLHCATCLDGLTNGEVLMKMFPQMKVTYTSNHVGLVDTDLDEFTDFRLDWWNAKWGE